MAQSVDIIDYKPYNITIIYLITTFSKLIIQQTLYIR